MEGRKEAWITGERYEKDQQAWLFVAYTVASCKTRQRWRLTPAYCQQAFKVPSRKLSPGDVHEELMTYQQLKPLI